jgi:hypothetical protein
MLVAALGVICWRQGEANLGDCLCEKTYGLRSGTARKLKALQMLTLRNLAFMLSRGGACCIGELVVGHLFCNSLEKNTIQLVYIPLPGWGMQDTT